MKIIRIKKSFRKYKEFWYNGMAGAIFFVTDLNDAEYKVHEFDPVFSWEDEITGVGKINKQHAGRMVLKRHAEVVGKFMKTFSQIWWDNQNPHTHKLLEKFMDFPKTRRVWYWDGAASLSQMAVDGVSKPQNCKFSVVVSSNEIVNVIETLQLSEKALDNLYKVAIWKQ